MAMASGFNWIGDNAIHFPDASVQKVVAHAIMGGLLAELTGSDFKTGAAAAGLNEVMVSSMGDLGRDNKELRLVLSQLTGLVAAAAVDADLDKGVAIAKGATQYNHDLHETAAKQVAQEALDHCRKNPQLCDLGIDFSKLTVDDIVFAMRVEGEHGKGIENAKPEAIAFVDGFMFSRAPKLRDALYTETESERSRLDVENKATLALSVISLGNAVRNFGNFLQGLVRATPTGVPVVKAVDELGAKGSGGAGQAAKNPNSTSAMTDAEAGMPYSHPVKPAAKGGGAVPNLTERGTLTNVFPNDPAIAQRPIKTLVQDSSGRYWLQTPSGSKITPSGSYDFVTMPDGTVRVSRPNVNEAYSTHLGLKDGFLNGKKLSV